MKRTYLYSLLSVVVMALIALVYFFPDDIDGRVLEQHDIRQGIANGQEAKHFQETTGETTRWTNALCGGMPTFQISPSYASAPLLNWIAKAYSLWLPSPANLLFIMMTGFFIMALCMKMRWYVALFGAIAWAFSSYFIIIIGAGHIWKFVTLAYIPPTLGGIFLCYRGKYLAGTALAALFGALQLMSNHIQMSYYFLFVVLAIMIACGVRLYKSKNLKQWAIATACIIGAGAIAVAANSASLYNTAKYSKETVRGRATDLHTEGEAPKEGADFDFITQWSYGGDESLSLIIPNVKGGATIKPVGAASQRLGVMDTPEGEKSTLSPEEAQFANQFPQYFGNQPMTNGPVYVGIVIFMLALMAIPLCRRSPLMWALWGVSILAWLLSLGHNFEWFSRLFIDYFPGYNKFRAVSSILVVVEFAMPLLAMMTLQKIISMMQDTDDNGRLKHNQAYVQKLTLGTGGALASICLLLWCFPSLMGSGLTVNETQQLEDILHDPLYSPILTEIKRLRLSLVSADAVRSLIFVVIGAVIVRFYAKGTLKQPAIFVGAIACLCLIDLYTVDKRYVNSENFTAPLPAEESFEMTDADRQILQDPDPDYRVLNIDDMGGARSSYFHKTIGGYHAAKLTRYNDLMEHQIMKMNPGVLNMLNTKYFLGMARNEQNQPIGDREGNPMWIAEQNPDALGHAWWVQSIDYVDNANAEMAALDNLDTRHAAVADKSFEKILGKASADSTATVTLTKYAPNRLNYKTVSNTPGVVVFSEIYFPWGWTATIDGKEAPIGRANYVLRALQVPAGTHDIEFTFNPKSLEVTNDISVAAVILIYILCAAAIAVPVVVCLRRKKK
ncbi:MAG: YfhO family protein [Bacteroidales bacterium]|nr:YfhO family protein [Bacteroidales bacterium]